MIALRPAEELSVSAGARSARRRSRGSSRGTVEQPAARRRSVSVRQLRAARPSRGRRHEGPRSSVEHRISARRCDSHHRKTGTPSDRPRRQAGSESSRRHAGSHVARHDGRTDGHRAAPELRAEQVDLHLVPQADGHGEERGWPRRADREQLDPPRHLGRQGVDRRARHLRRRRYRHGSVAHHVRTRWHALHGDWRSWHRLEDQHGPRAVDERSRREDSAG